MSTLFISHSSRDDGFVRELRQALAEHGEEVWIDSRELRGGDPLWTEIQTAIEAAAGFAVVVSPDALQSKWVGKELKLALKLQKKRGRDKFPVIPLSLDGTQSGVLEEFFGEEPLYIPVSSEAGGVEAAIDAILVAMGQRLPADVAATPQPQAEPLEELVLELTDLKFHEQDGIRRASARARLVYQPATPGQREVASAQAWRFVAPIGPIETADLRWYLEQYAIWPSGVPVIRDRARRVERDLTKWGGLLHDAALPVAHVANVKEAWARISDHADRRFSVYVDLDATLEAGTADDARVADDQVRTAKEVATLLLGLPWELLHDGEDYLFQGAKPTRIRRRLPNTRVLDVPVVATPIRVLLVTARPEDDACGYIDHRASALPLVEAMEALPGLVRLHVLSPPTLPALREELDRARRERQPYHVVHFDGHGVYDRQVGLGGLCFEHPDDIGKLEKRRHVTVYTQDSPEHGSGLGSLLRDHRIPLVFLEACQTAQAEQASESVAAELLKVGVASVVAMSHSVLVETARQFVAAFYHSLAAGRRVGEAMLAGQRRLKDDTRRGRVFGADELRLEDWFVPVLFQEKADPQLFRVTPSQQARDDFQTRLAARLGDLPPAPETGFIGRSRELLALERQTVAQAASLPDSTACKPAACTTYAVIRGQGGEGKTALAAEFARWMVRSQQMRRAAFVSVEGLERNIVEVVLDNLGQQLVQRGFSTQVECNGDLDQAEQQIVRALREQPTLLVMDNMESVLLPPFVQETTPEALSAEAQAELTAVLDLCARLLRAGETRLIFTSREWLPAPFDAQSQQRELHRLDRSDAVKLVERVLNVESRLSLDESGAGRTALSQSERRLSAEAALEQIELLVDAVHCHSRTLALLAPALRERGVEATRGSLVELMAQMQQRFPGSREQSVFASVELSLQRMSPANRDRALVLGVFHSGVNLAVLRMMMGWDEADAGSLAVELVRTGLATPNRFNHLTLNPALCPYLRAGLAIADEPQPGKPDSPSLDALTARWIEATRAYAGFLEQQRSQNTELAATLTVLELPNLFALLELVQRAGDAEATIALATSLYSLLQFVGKPRLLERVGQVRDAAAAELGDAWNHARFEAARTRIEQQLAGGQLREALGGAEQLLQRARTAGDLAYPDADYDLAMACILLARVLQTAGGAEQALPLLDEARQRFEAIVAVSLRETDAPSRSERATLPAARMASACLTEQGECLRGLGRLDAAAEAYEVAIRRAEQCGADRDVAVGKGQLGTVRKNQRRYPEALAAYAEARERFTQLDEPGSVAVSWHQTGMVYQAWVQPDAAENAYRKSLAINVRLGNIAGQASTLGQLGNLYDDVLERPEEAAAFYQQAVDKYVEIHDAAGEGRQRNNLARTLQKLGRLDEARREIRRAIECKAQFGHASSPWTSWAILAGIETDAGRAVAAADAQRKAIDSYLAYRRAGGENHFDDGRIAHAVTAALEAGNAAEATGLLEQLAADPDADWLLPFIQSLQSIVSGSRDRTLADVPGLDHTMAAEILFLIETLSPAPPA